MVVATTAEFLVVLGRFLQPGSFVVSVGALRPVWEVYREALG